MSPIAKPAEGSWTAHYPDLGTEPISYEDSISPEMHELERVMRSSSARGSTSDASSSSRGRSYFTKELAILNTSVVIVRDLEGEVRAVLQQHLPAPGNQARVDLIPEGGVERQRPRVSSHASTTAGSTTSTACAR